MTQQDTLTLAEMGAAMRQLTPPQYAAAMNALDQARQTGDLAQLVDTLGALAREHQ
jgi:hypothetical protein